MKITVVGSGYVGLVAAACLAELGHQAVCVDVDRERIAQLQAGVVPLHEAHLPELLARHGGRSLSFSSDLHASVTGSAAVFIAVGTPAHDSGEADLSYVEAVARELAGAVNQYTLIVEKSTVPVHTCEWIRRVMRLNGAPEGSYDVASNPEFLREGSAVTDFLYPDRIVIGADSPRATALLREIFAPLASGEYARRADALVRVENKPAALVIETSARSAELIKHASNAFLAMKISFINAIANLCEAAGADIEQVCRGVGSDARIGQAFLQPGIGYGGSCFPKDLSAFRAVARELGYDFALLDEIRRVNEEQRQRFVAKVRRALWTLRGKRIAALGLAYKRGTDDVRESPAIDVIELLLKEGCQVAAFDPAGMERAKEVLGERIAYAPSAYDAATDADALVVLTDWPEFAALDLERLRAAMKYPIVIDGRNLFSPARMAEFGFIYLAVGRADAPAQHTVGSR